MKTIIVFLFLILSLVISQGQPTITNQPSSLVRYAGSTATFSAVAGPPSGLDYQWFFSSSPIALYSKTNTYSITNITSANAGSYYLKLTNSGGATTSSVVTLTVNLAPTNLPTPTSGSTVSVTVGTNGVLHGNPSTNLFTANIALMTNALTSAGFTGGGSGSASATNHIIFVLVTNNNYVAAGDTNGMLTTNFVYSIGTTFSNILFTMPPVFPNSFMVENDGTNAVVLTNAPTITFRIQNGTNAPVYVNAISNSYATKVMTFAMLNATNIIILAEQPTKQGIKIIADTEVSTQPLPLANATGTLPTAQLPAFTGDITTSAGSAATTLKSTGTAGTYTKPTFDAQGRETSGTTLAFSDLSPAGFTNLNYLRNITSTNGFYTFVTNSDLSVTATFVITNLGANNGSLLTGFTASQIPTLTLSKISDAGSASFLSSNAFVTIPNLTQLKIPTNAPTDSAAYQSSNSFASSLNVGTTNNIFATASLANAPIQTNASIVRTNDTTWFQQKSANIVTNFSLTFLNGQTGMVTIANNMATFTFGNSNQFTVANAATLASALQSVPVSSTNLFATTNFSGAVKFTNGANIFGGDGSGLSGVATTNGTVQSATIRVDKSGNNTTGKRGNYALPVLTISNALTKAQSGDLINVGAGTFYETAFAGTNVNYYFPAGSGVAYTNQGDGADSPVQTDMFGDVILANQSQPTFPITNIISGDGNFEFETISTSYALTSFLALENTNSIMEFHGSSLIRTNQTYSINGGIWMLGQKHFSLYLNLIDWTSADSGSDADGSSAITWNGGDADIHVHTIIARIYGSCYSYEEALPFQNTHFSLYSDYLNATNSADNCLWAYGSSETNSVQTFHVGLMEAGTGAVIYNYVGGGGKWYVLDNAKTWNHSSTSPVIDYASAEAPNQLWFTSQKCSAEGLAGSSAGLLRLTGTGSGNLTNDANIHLDVSDWQDLGTNNHTCFEINYGTVLFNGGNIKPSGGRIFKIGNARVTLKDFRADSSNSTNDCLFIAASSDITLDGGIYTAASGAFAINATNAQTITLNGCRIIGNISANISLNLTGTNWFGNVQVISLTTSNLTVLGTAAFNKLPTVNGISVLTNNAGTSGLVQSNYLTCAQATNVFIYTVPSGVTNFYDVHSIIKITAVTTDVAQMQVLYTDENNNSQTKLIGAALSTTGTTPVSPVSIWCKGGTTVTLQVALTTSIGSIAFDAGGKLVGWQ